MKRSLAMTTSVKIPQRAVYKAAEVCAIAKLQPYVLRSWEAEFPDLGVEQSGSRLRVYRRAHLDMVLRIKELLFVEGLTLGAARRKILKETPAADGGEQQPLEELLGADAQARVEDVKAGLRSILSMLSVSGNGDGVPPLERSAAGDDVLGGPAPTRATPKTAGARRASSNVGGKRRRTKA
jgi:DNA-binding transcriptional MerR regulator